MLFTGENHSTGDFLSRPKPLDIDVSRIETTSSIDIPAIEAVNSIHATKIEPTNSIDIPGIQAVNSLHATKMEATSDGVYEIDKQGTIL